MCGNALDNNADESNTYLKAELDFKFTTSNLLKTTTLSNSPSVDLGGICRLVKSADHNTFSIDRCSLNSLSTYMV